MHVEVENALARRLSTVAHDSEPLPDPERGRNPRGDGKEVTRQLLIALAQLGEGAYVALRYHKHVNGRLGIDVTEGKRPFILVHHVRRDLMSRDLAE